MGSKKGGGHLHCHVNWNILWNNYHTELQLLCLGHTISTGHAVWIG